MVLTQPKLLDHRTICYNKMERLDPMIPGSPGAKDVPVMQAWLEALYKYEESEEKSHQMHKLYTKLIKKYNNTMSTDG